jgi:pimeloyl-ACP methyl ester carboxylesterase
MTTQRLAELEQSERREKIHPDSRSIALTHSDGSRRAYLLLHGFTASPRQFIQFAEYLYERGHNVFVPRLPRHGYRDRLTEATAALTADELREAASAGLEVASELGDRVTVVGFSLGGLLAVRLAQLHAVERVVAIAPFLGSAAIPHRLSRGVATLALRAPNQFWWWDPRMRERQMPAHGYPQFPTHGVAHAYGIVHEVFDLARSSGPLARDIVLVTNDRESTVNNRSVRKIASLWQASGAPNVRVHRLIGLPPSHDIIEPLRNPGLVDRVFPELAALVDPL